ncbi:MAG: hypothetical protein GX096_01630 [Clostridiales bacterium]|nr:hypothetical protein [Clostridiales bacterium]
MNQSNGYPIMPKRHPSEHCAAWARLSSLASTIHLEYRCSWDCFVKSRGLHGHIDDFCRFSLFDLSMEISLKRQTAGNPFSAQANHERKTCRKLGPMLFLHPTLAVCSQLHMNGIAYLMMIRLYAAPDRLAIWRKTNSPSGVFCGALMVAFIVKQMHFMLL